MSLSFSRKKRKKRAIKSRKGFETVKYDSDKQMERINNGRSEKRIVIPNKFL